MLDNLKGWRTIALAVATALVNGLATGDVLPPDWALIYNTYILPPLMLVLRSLTDSPIGRK